MLIPMQPQPAGEVHLLPHLSPSGVRYPPHAMEVGRGFDTEFFTCDDGDPVDIVQQDGVWFWEV